MFGKSVDEALKSGRSLRCAQMNSGRDDAVDLEYLSVRFPSGVALDDLNHDVVGGVVPVDESNAVEFFVDDFHDASSVFGLNSHPAIIGNPSFSVIEMC